MLFMAETANTITIGSRRFSSKVCSGRSTPVQNILKPSQVSVQRADWKTSNGALQNYDSSIAIKNKLLIHEPIHLDTNNMEAMKGRVKMALRNCRDASSRLKLIDSIDCLGLSHHFEQEIKSHMEMASWWNSSSEDLMVTSLSFRLLRNHGYPTNSDVFNKFLDREGRFNTSLIRDTWSLLSLFEASHLGTQSEEVLSKAMIFTRNQLKRSMPFMDQHTRSVVSQSLKLPRHLRMRRLASRDSMDGLSKDCNSWDLLQLGKLDFAMVQSMHQSELAELKRWWKELGLVEKLGFGRDRPTECFFWTVGIFPEPCHSHCRIELAKTVSILLVLDDMYDTYGSLEELTLFTHAIKRWDLGAMEDLPEYMKICYTTLYNTTHEIADNVFRKHGWSIVEHLKRTWFDIFEAFQMEANWFHRGYTPKLNEYLSNGVTSSGSYMALVHSFFFIGKDVTKRTTSMLYPYPKPFECAGKILRLWDDLGTSTEEQERGDVASSLQCYMEEEEGRFHEMEARNFIKQLIGNLWTELNGYLTDSTSLSLPLPIVNASLNLARAAQAVYQHGDDRDLPNVRDQVQRLIFTQM